MTGTGDLTALGGPQAVYSLLSHCLCRPLSRPSTTLADSLLSPSPSSVQSKCYKCRQLHCCAAGVAAVVTSEHRGFKRGTETLTLRCPHTCGVMSQSFS